MKQCIRSGGGGKNCLRLARDLPSSRIHCCWTELLRALVLPIGVSGGGPVGSVGALALGGRRWWARVGRRERSGGGCDGSSVVVSRVPAVAPRLMGNQGMRAEHKAHRSSRVLLPGLFNQRGIGWLVSRSHAPWNVRLGLVWSALLWQDWSNKGGKRCSELLRDRLTRCHRPKVVQ